MTSAGKLRERSLAASLIIVEFITRAPATRARLDSVQISILPRDVVGNVINLEFFAFLVLAVVTENGADKSRSQKSIENKVTFEVLNSAFQVAMYWRYSYTIV